MTAEVVFDGDCQICGEREVSCRNHHLIPRRLLAILPKGKASKWEFQKLRICNRCNNYMHPENRLYRQIFALKKQLGYKLTEEEQAIEKKMV